VPSNENPRGKFNAILFNKYLLGCLIWIDEDGKGGFVGWVDVEISHSLWVFYWGKFSTCHSSKRKNFKDEIPPAPPTSIYDFNQSSLII
jgi:hypothetical protein